MCLTSHARHTGESARNHPSWLPRQRPAIVPGRFDIAKLSFERL
jgi:hypothetical protein